MYWQCVSCPLFRSIRLKDLVAHIRVAHNHGGYNVTCGIMPKLFIYKITICCLQFWVRVGLGKYISIYPNPGRSQIFIA